MTVTGALDPEVACTHPLPKLPWQCQADGSVHTFLLPNGESPTKEDLIADAEQWERCFSTDVRFLSAHNQDHACATTCVKKMKKATAQEKTDAVKKTKAPPCRFWFFHIVVISILDGVKETVRRIRRRAKEIKGPKHTPHRRPPPPPPSPLFPLPPNRISSSPPLAISNSQLVNA